MKTLPMNQCKVPGCDRLAYSRGFCRQHYNALLMGKSPRCKVEDCHRPAWALNLCQTHYRYWKRHQAGGKTDIPPPSQPKRNLVIHQISSGVRDKPEPSGVMVLAACRVWLRKRGLTRP